MLPYSLAREEANAAAKLIVIYPVPTDLEQVNVTMFDQHVPMAVDRLVGKTKIVATKVLSFGARRLRTVSSGLRSIFLRCRRHRRAPLQKGRTGNYRERCLHFDRASTDLHRGGRRLVFNVGPTGIERSKTETFGWYVVRMGRRFRRSRGKWKRARLAHREWTCSLPRLTSEGYFVLTFYYNVGRGGAQGRPPLSPSKVGENGA